MGLFETFTIRELRACQLRSHLLAFGVPMFRSLRKLIMLLVVAPAALQGAITWSGIQNIPISSTFGGVYLDFQDPDDAGAFAVDPGGVVSFSTASVPWDVNLFFGGAGIAVSDTASAHAGGVGGLDPVINLAAGSLLSLSDTFPSGFSGSLGHIGPGLGQFPSSADGAALGYVGFRLEPSSFPSASPAPSGPVVGWMAVVLQDDGSPGLIRDWAWETSANSIEVGAIPEPKAFGMVLLAAFAGVLRRKRV